MKFLLRIKSVLQSPKTFIIFSEALYVVWSENLTSIPRRRLQTRSEANIQNDRRNLASTSPVSRTKVQMMGMSLKHFLHEYMLRGSTAIRERGWKWGRENG